MQKQKALGRVLSMALIVCMVSGIVIPSRIDTRADEITSDPSDAVLLTNTLTYTAPGDVDAGTGETNASGLSVELTSEAGFPDSETAYIASLAGEDREEALKTLEKEEEKEFEVIDSYEIAVKDSTDSDVSLDEAVTVKICAEDTGSLKDASLYHIKDDGTVESLPFELGYEEPDTETQDEPEFNTVTFTAESFSPFLFVKEKEEKEEESVSLTSGTKAEDAGSLKGTKETKAEEADSVKEASESVPETSAAKKARKAAAQKIDIRELSTELFYGAEKDGDLYVWTADTKTAGHKFAYRISFSISGVGEAAAGQISFRIPKTTLVDRGGKSADSVEWSIPSKDSVEEATGTDGTVDENLIDSDIDYCYYEDGDDFMIENFREVPAGDNGYIEVAYATTKTSFSYEDRKEMNPFTCTMTVKNDSGDVTKTSEPITTAIDTAAEITSTEKRYPYTRHKEWSDSWGTAVKPENPENYYYLVWDIRSYVNATQPYTFTIDDTLTSNHGNKMTVLGYRFDGQTGFGTSNKIENQTATDARWDAVLTAIPLDTYGSEDYWEAVNTEKATVTPKDGVDAATSRSDTQKWTWNKPVFHEPPGRFNTYKRGDGAYRTYVMGEEKSIYTGTEEPKDDKDFKAGKYSRYDLEAFNGYNGEEKTLSSYDNLDFVSWSVGYPYPWTRLESSDPLDPESYGKKPVKYVLTDDEVFLIRDLKAIVSDDGSENRTIENGGLVSTVGGDTEAARKLTHDDFRIPRLEYSWYMKDASYNEDTAEFTATDVTYTDTDILSFYGKFNGSDDWTLFATYNIKTGTASPVDEFVKYMDKGTIVLKDGQDLTGYRVETENAHYSTQLVTVPFYELKESMSEYLKDKTDAALMNNNAGTVYEYSESKEDYNGTPIVEMKKSDADYFCISQRDSELTKEVSSMSNNAKKKTVSITWRISLKETMTSGENGETSFIPQNGGIFYDLLPDGGTLDKNTVEIWNGNKTLPESAYEIKTIENYKDTGRTMLVIRIKEEGERYEVTFDTKHTWNDVNDYGTSTYNPVAYETGNDSITKGFPDNGGTMTKDGKKNENPIKEASLFEDVAKNTGMSGETVTDARFLYAEDTYDLKALMSASSGLTKKVRAGDDAGYSDSTETEIDGNYSYELRYTNSHASRAKDLILFDVTRRVAIGK